MNRIDALFQHKTGNILSLYFTAGYPYLEATRDIILELDACGADLLEVGIPFSDPMADGPVIQASSAKALSNGMTIDRLFEQLKDIREHTAIPLVLMGYLNPILQYGMQRFCSRAQAIGIDGLIIPDLPPREYALQYKDIMEAAGLHMIFLATPATPPERLRYIDRLSRGFIYLVTTAGTTGGALTGSAEQQAYFESMRAAGLQNPFVAGFGISTRSDFERVCQYTRGAIIGSRFILALGEEGKSLQSRVRDFVSGFS